MEAAAMTTPEQAQESEGGKCAYCGWDRHSDQHERICLSKGALPPDPRPGREDERVQRIEITRDGDWMVVSDEDGEFARVDGEARALLPYLRDLIYGCGTLKSKGLMADD